MSSYRSVRRALGACTALVAATLSTAIPAFAQNGPSGVVVDQTGRALPRAFVRELDSSGAESAST